MAYRLPSTACALLLLLQPFSTARGQVTDGLETAKWVQSHYSNPVKLSLVQIEGRGKVLEVECRAGSTPRANIRTDHRWNGREFPYVVMDYRRQFGHAVPVAIAVNSGPKKVFHESSLRRPPHDDEFHRVFYDLSQHNFKCARVNWIQGVPIDNVDELHQLQVQVWPQDRRKMAGKFFLDNIRLVRGLFESRRLEDAPFEVEEVGSAVPGDFDNDGILDRLQTAPEFRLLKGEEDGTFAEVPDNGGLRPTKVAAWADLDRDGNLDLVSWRAEAGSLSLMVGDGTGRFQDRTAEWALPDGTLASPVRNIYAMDEEPDGDQDLFLGLEDGSWLVWQSYSAHGPRSSTFLEVCLEEALEGEARVRLSDQEGKRFGARVLSRPKGQFRGPSSRQMYFVPPGVYSLTISYPGGKDRASEIVVHEFGQRLGITSRDVFALWPRPKAAVDGIMSDGEWDDAARIEKTLAFVDYKTKKDEVHQMTMWYQADPYALYLCIKIENDDFGNGRLADMLTVHFDNDGDGLLEDGHDAHCFWSQFYNDYYVLNSGQGWPLERDPFLDGRGVVKHSNPRGLGDYVYELRIPWKSHDSRDLAIDRDSALGIKVTFCETQQRNYKWHRSDSAGIDGFPNGNLWIKGTYGRLVVRGPSREAGSPPGKVEVVIRSPEGAPKITGSVKTADGRPVAGARVELGRSWNGDGRGVSDVHGNFEVALGPPPKGKVGAAAESWLTAYAPGFAPKTQKVKVAEGVHHFALGPGKPLAGVVLDEKDKPLARADLSVSTSDSRVMVAQCNTDGAGRFRLENVPDVPELFLSVRHVERRVYLRQTVKPGRTDLEISSKPPVRARGRVVSAKDGTPLPRFSLRFATAYGHARADTPTWSPWYWRDGTAKQFNSAAGEFDFRFGSHGSYRFRLCADAPGYASGVIDRDFLPGDDVSGLEVRLERGFVLTGKATSRPDAKAVKNATITVRSVTDKAGLLLNRLPSQQATTDAAGKFRFDSLTPGKHEVTGSAQGFAPLAVQAIDVSEVESNQLSLTFRIGVTVDGVFRGEGKGIPNARLILVPTVQAHRQRRNSARTEPNGSFRFTNIASGAYLVYGPAPSGSAVASRRFRPYARIDVPEEGTLSVLLGGDGSGQRVRCLVKTGDAPAPNVSLNIERAGVNSPVNPIWDTVTDKDGRFELTDMPPGEYTVRKGSSMAQTKEGQELTLTVSPETGEAVTVLSFEEEAQAEEPDDRAE